MAATAQEIFTNNVRDLPPSERLRLAAIILKDLTESGGPRDRDNTWSDEDQADLTAFSLQHAAQCYPEAEDLV